MKTLIFLSVISYLFGLIGLTYAWLAYFGNMWYDIPGALFIILLGCFLPFTIAADLGYLEDI